MRALVTGATGFIGRRLVSRLERPVVLTRDLERAHRSLGNVDARRWDPMISPPAGEAFEGVEAVFHLAGEPVAGGRWTPARKALIRESRVQGTRHLVAALEALPQRPRVLVSASGVGYYGDRGDEVLDESAPPGGDFLAEVCKAWEAEAMRAAALGVRVVRIRIGLVLGEKGGALARMLTPFKLGLGGRLGSGRQWMSWIHLDDLIGLFLHSAQRPEVSGAVNAVAPNPVTNREFTRVLAWALHRPAVFPVPAFALRLMFGEMASVLLGSQRVAPRAAEQAGFPFAYPELRQALPQIVSR